MYIIARYGLFLCFFNFVELKPFLPIPKHGAKFFSENNEPEAIS